MFGDNPDGVLEVGMPLFIVFVLDGHHSFCAQKKKPEPKKPASNKPKRPDDDDVSTFNTDKWVHLATFFSYPWVLNFM